MINFSLDKNFALSYAELKPPFGFNGLGEFVYRRTYSRLKPNGTNERWFETVERVVNGCYRMQEDWIKERGLDWNATKAQISAQEMYDRIFNMKFLPPGRGLWAMGSAVTEERKMFAALNNCFSGEEEFVTREGFKKFKDTVGTTQTILTENGEWKDVPVKSFGYQKLWKLTLQRQGVQKDIFTTANHRWFSKTKSELSHSKGWGVRNTSDLVEGMRLRYAFGQRVENFSPQGVVHGYAFGDGTGNRIDVCNPEDGFIFEYTEMNRRSGSLKDRTVIKDIPAHYKDRPLLSWDRKYLQGWLMGYFAADGSCDKNGQITISSSDKTNLTFVQEVCSILGIGYYSVNLSSISSNFKAERELYKLALMPSTLSENFFLKETHKNNFQKEKVKRHWNVFSVEETNVVEEVFCVQVKEKESFTLRDQIFTKNCAFVSTKNLDVDLHKPFCFLMDMSMLGVGVGFDTKGKHKVVINTPLGKPTQFTIPDSREGWVKSLELLLQGYFVEGHKPVKFIYSNIRSAGLAIKGFGGTASGPDPLIEMHKLIRGTLDPLSGNPITVTAIVDLMNMIGKCVVAGNVRRSAEIAFGAPNDEEFMNLKNPELFSEELKSHRWCSNNSIFGEVGMDYDASASRTQKNGEPGYAWLENMKAYSRMNNGPDHKDRRAEGGNPCLEQTLESYELCCLVETFPYRNESLEDFQRTLKFAYLYAKTVTLGQSHWVETNRVMLRNRRIGCSMSGIAQFVENRGLHELKEWCEHGYQAVQRYDKAYSEWLFIPESIKTTSVKPSGSVSLLAGATPGVHYPISRFYIVRVRASKTHKILKNVFNAGYSMEADVTAPDNTTIPVDVGDIRPESKVSMWEKLSLCAFMQKYWADNQVSATINFDRELEGPQIKHALTYFQYQLKGVSFLPRDPNVYPQMTYEAISEQQYTEMLTKVQPIIWTENEESTPDKYCDSDVCSL